MMHEVCLFEGVVCVCVFGCAFSQLMNVRAYYVLPLVYRLVSYLIPSPVKSLRGLLLGIAVIISSLGWFLGSVQVV